MAVGIALVGYAALAWHYVRNNALNADESFYAYASFRALQGELPYADFAYTQTPLLPYVNGIVLEIGGYSLTLLRSMGAWAGAISLVAVVYALRSRLGSWLPGAFAAFAIAASPHWVALQAMGKTYAVAGAALSVATCALVARGPLVPRIAILSVAGALAIGSRLTCAPCVVVLAVGLALQARTRGMRLAALAMPIAAVLFGHLPFAAADWEAARFFVIDYHRGSAMADARSFSHVVNWFETGTAPIVLLGLGTVLLRRPFAKRGLVAGTLLAAWSGILTPFLQGGGYGEYVAPFLPIASLAGALAMWPSPQERWMRRAIGRALWLLPALALTLDLPATHPREGQRLRKLATLLEKRAPEGEVLTPLPLVALAARRSLVEGTDMGVFSTFPNGDEARATRLHLTTLAQLTEAVATRRPAALVLFAGRHQWNFGYEVPRIVVQPRSAQQAFMAQVHCHYDKVKRLGNLVLYVRKTGPQVPCPEGGAPKRVTLRPARAPVISPLAPRGGPGG